MHWVSSCSPLPSGGPCIRFGSTGRVVLGSDCVLKSDMVYIPDVIWLYSLALLLHHFLYMCAEFLFAC